MAAQLHQNPPSHSAVKHQSSYPRVSRVDRMTTECSYTIEEETAAEGLEDNKVLVKRDGVLTSVLRRLSQFWPVRLTMRALRGFWWLFGFTGSEDKAVAFTPAEEGNASPRQCLSGRKRLPRVTRLLMAILPRRLQSALGYPVCTSIGCSLSPEVRVSPTKPCGKGSKRKQDDLNEDEEEEEGEPKTWVGFLTQEELAVEEDSTADPDYESPSVVETDSEEYCSNNDTDCEPVTMSADGTSLLIIEDLQTGLEVTASS